MKVKVVDFTGGEPLLHRQLPEFLTYAKSLGLITTVTTNTLLYPKYAETLRGKIDMLHFSLDSVDRDRHNASRKVDCFNHLIRSIGIARELGERPDILFTITDENVGEIAEAYDRFVLQEGLVLILNPLFAYNGVGSGLAVSTLDELAKWSGKKGIYLNEAFIRLRREGGNQIEDPICKAGSSTVVISPENTLIMPCYHLDLAQYPINGDLHTLYHSEPVQKEIAMEGKHPGCEGCEINCYMEPSFTLELNRYFAQSLKSTLKYSLEKWVYS